MASSFNHQQTSNGKESDTDVDCCYSYYYIICEAVTEPGVWKWGRGYTKTGLAGDLSHVWQGIWETSLPQQKHEFGIGRDVISRCLDGCTCTLQSLLSWYSITFWIPPPSLFLCIFGQIM